MRWIITVACFSLTLVLSAQQSKQSAIDSLQEVLKDKTQSDTNKVWAAVGLSSKTIPDMDKAMEYARTALVIARKTGDSIWVARGLQAISTVDYFKGEYPEAIAIQKRIVDIYKAEKKDETYYSAVSNLGILYRKIGRFRDALQCYHEVLDMREKEGDKANLASIFNNLGNLYNSADDPHKGLEYHRKALNLKLSLNDSTGVASSYNNIGNIYQHLQMNDSAIFFYKKSLSYAIPLKMDNLHGSLTNNLGNLLTNEGDYTAAEQYILESQVLRRRTKNLYGYAVGLNNLGRVKGLQGRLNEALPLLDSALKIGEDNGLDRIIVTNTAYRAEAFKDAGRYKDALDYFLKYYRQRDSLQVSAEKEQLSLLDAQFQHDRQQLQDSLARAKQEEIEQLEYQQEKSRTRLILWSGGGMILLITVLALVLFIGYRSKHKANQLISQQKEEVEHQKAVVEEKNTEITDSITYAYRLQQAVLPSVSAIQEALKGSFLFYQPKDIVAGDFYWMEEKSNEVYFAVADCTGHGVPGAMVSMVCANALDKAVKDLKLKDPAEILNKTRELVIERFDKSNDEVKDGMDIAFCILNSATGELKFAGANNPLYHIKALDDKVTERDVQNETHYVQEIKGDKQPIGKHLGNRPFATHKVKVNKGDSIYIFTDGFADQFGGERGKKFKYRPFKKLLLKNFQLPPNKQKENISSAFNDWMGTHEQLDDICVMGVKIS